MYSEGFNIDRQAGRQTQRKEGKKGVRERRGEGRRRGHRCECRAAYELCPGTRVYTAISHLCPRGQHRAKHGHPRTNEHVQHLDSDF